MSSAKRSQVYGCKITLEGFGVRIDSDLEFIGDDLNDLWVRRPEKLIAQHSDSLVSGATRKRY